MKKINQVEKNMEYLYSYTNSLLHTGREAS